MRSFPKIPGYEIESVIGRGGMGRVYLARDKKLGRVVAIKCLMQFEDAEMVRRFEDEARAAGQLQHPQIAQLFEFRTDSEQPYLVREYLSGRTLSELMNSRPG